MKKTLEQICREYPKYKPAALRFIYEGLGATIEDIREKDAQGESRHISGAELARGLCRQAVKRWGRLAKMVLNEWGIYETRDFGEIVYIMIENRWMSAQDNDKIEDFDNVFDFEQVFEKHYNFENA